MAPNKLYSYPGQGSSVAVLAAANYNGVQIELVPCSPNDATVKSVYKFGKVPAFGTGECTFGESGAILRHVIRTGRDVGLYGANPAEMAQVDMWIDWAQMEIYENCKPWLYPILGYASLNELAKESSKKRLTRAMTYLNEHLLDRTFLVGERITAADLSVVGRLISCYRDLFVPAFRKPFGNVNRWFTTVVNQPEYQSANVGVGPVVMCEREAQYTEAKKAAPAAATAAAPKKDEERKTVPPKTSFSMDGWKRTYSNERDTAKAMVEFWKTYDPNAMSIWHADYMYAKDNTSQLQIRNLLGGTFQRMERARKFAFGVITIYDDLTMDGYFVCLGKDLPYEIQDCPDSESYKWTKVDPLDAAAKKNILECWAAEGDFNGRKYADSKIFK